MTAEELEAWIAQLQGYYRPGQPQLPPGALPLPPAETRSAEFGGTYVNPGAFHLPPQERDTAAYGPGYRPPQSMPSGRSPVEAQKPNASPESASGGMTPEVQRRLAEAQAYFNRPAEEAALAQRYKDQIHNTIANRIIAEQGRQPTQQELQAAYNRYVMNNTRSTPYPTPLIDTRGAQMAAGNAAAMGSGVFLTPITDSNWSGYTSGISMGTGGIPARDAAIAASRYAASRGLAKPKEHLDRAARATSSFGNPIGYASQSQIDRIKQGYAKYQASPGGNSRMSPERAAEIQARQAQQPASQPAADAGLMDALLSDYAAARQPAPAPSTPAASQPPAPAAPAGNPVSGSMQSPETLSQLAGEYQQQMDRANQANEDRYQELVQGYTDRYQRAFGTPEGEDGTPAVPGYFDNLGRYESERIDRQYDRQQGSAEQNLISRGLGNTTVRPNVQRGIELDRARAQGELGERLTMQRAQMDANLSGDLLAMMERRTDAAPDYGQLAAIAAAQGQGGVGVQQNPTQQFLNGYQPAGYQAPQVAGTVQPPATQPPSPAGSSTHPQPIPERPVPNAPAGAQMPQYSPGGVSTQAADPNSRIEQQSQMGLIGFDGRPSTAVNSQHNGTILPTQPGYQPGVGQMSGLGWAHGTSMGPDGKPVTGWRQLGGPVNTLPASATTPVQQQQPQYSLGGPITAGPAQVTPQQTPQYSMGGGVSILPAKPQSPTAYRPGIVRAL